MPRPASHGMPPTNAPPPLGMPLLTPALRSLSAQAAALRNLLRQLPGHSPEIVVKVQPSVVRVGGQRPRASSIASAAAERRAPAPSGPAAAVPLSKTVRVEREDNPGLARPTASARRPPASAAVAARSVAPWLVPRSVAPLHTARSIAPLHAARLSVPRHSAARLAARPSVAASLAAARERCTAPALQVARERLQLVLRQQRGTQPGGPVVDLALLQARREPHAPCRTPHAARPMHDARLPPAACLPPPASRPSRCRRARPVPTLTVPCVAAHA